MAITFDPTQMRLRNLGTTVGASFDPNAVPNNTPQLSGTMIPPDNSPAQSNAPNGQFQMPAFTPSTTARDALTTHINQLPNYQKPSLLRRIGAGIAGEAYGPTGVNDVLDKPNTIAMNRWNQQNVPLERAATVEEQGNAQARAYARDTALGDLRNQQEGINQQKADTQIAALNETIKKNTDTANNNSAKIAELTQHNAYLHERNLGGTIQFTNNQKDANGKDIPGTGDAVIVRKDGSVLPIDANLQNKEDVAKDIADAKTVVQKQRVAQGAKAKPNIVYDKDGNAFDYQEGQGLKPITTPKNADGTGNVPISTKPPVQPKKPVIKTEQITDPSGKVLGTRTTTTTEGKDQVSSQFTPDIEAKIATGMKVTNPDTKQPYTRDEIVKYMQDKGIIKGNK